MLKIKKTIVSKIDEGKMQELYELEKSGDITHEELIEMMADKSSTEHKIDVAGTIKDNVKKAWDVVTDEDNFYKVTAIGFIGAMLFICGNTYRTNVKIRNYYK